MTSKPLRPCNPSSVHPTEDCEASQAPRSRKQNPELRTRSGRNLNLEDKTTSAFSPAEPRNREVSGFPDQNLAFASQPPVTNDYEISNVNLSTHLEELLRFKGKVDGQEAVFLLDSGSTRDLLRSSCVNMEWKRGLLMAISRWPLLKEGQHQKHGCARFPWRWKSLMRVKSNHSPFSPWRSTMSFWGNPG